MGIKEFIYKYFIKPLYTGEGYNMYNTLVYGALLLAGAYGVARFIRRFGVRMDRQIFYAVLPFVVLGGLLRALEEFARLTGAGLLPHSPLFLTPGIYLLVVALSLLALGIAVALRGKEYRSLMSAIGWIISLAAFLLVLMDITLVSSGKIPDVSLRPVLLFWITFTALGLTFLGTLVLKRMGMSDRGNTIILGGFAFEATAVATAVYSLSYSVEQPFTQMLLSINPLFYPLLKVGLILALIYIVEGIPKNDDGHWLSKLIFLVLGLPMGIHNSLQIFMGI